MAEIEELKVQRIQSNTWMVYTINKIVSTEKYGVDDFDESLHLYIIHVEENWEFFINNLHLRHLIVYEKKKLTAT